jgi:hypothetical protein
MIKFYIIVKNEKVCVLEVNQKIELEMKEVVPGVEIKPISLNDMFDFPTDYLTSRGYKSYVDDEFKTIDDCRKYLHSQGIYTFDCITFNGTFTDQSLNFVIRQLD